MEQGSGIDIDTKKVSKLASYKLDDVKVRLYGDVAVLASWQMLVKGSHVRRLSRLQLVSAVWLCATPFVFHYPTDSWVAKNDVIVGAISLMDSLIETWTIARVPPRTA